MTGQFTGSLQYAAPEQIDSFGVDQRSDIYSFGTVLYEMLTGKKTFPYNDGTSLLRAKLNNTYTPIQDFRVTVPYSLVKVLNNCIALEKTDRFETSSDLADALEGAFFRITRERPEAVLQDYAHKKGTTIHGTDFYRGVKKNVWKRLFTR
jgi:serine/threonine protein kinase